MRHLFFGCLMAFLIASCNNTGKNAAVASAMADSTRYTTIQWLDSSRDYGKIPEGQKLDVAFRFRNTGTTPLVIGNVRPSCGCTVAEQSQEPIAPGAEGQIRATFNSEGRSGINHKPLFVPANTRGTQAYSVQFVVEVVKKA